LNIDRVERLSERTAVGAGERACFEFYASGELADEAGLRERFFRAAEELGIDIAFQHDNIWRRSRRLIAFDMDSTLVQAEVIDELAREAGVGEQVAAITAAAMRGELDFAQSFRRRVALLRGLPEARLHAVAERIALTEGAERLFRAVKQLGYRTVVLSGGFQWFGRLLAQKLPIDELHANELAIRDGVVTGEVLGEIVDGRRKAALLEEIAAREGIRMEQVVAVGDGANDLAMIARAGLGIAFHAKPVVRANARHAISTVGLDGILYLLGLRDREL
jgi:phosphoserine phosphatase